MKELFFLLAELFLKIVDYFPFWIWKIIFIFSKKKNIFKNKSNKDIKYIENMIWLDFNGYVGDFFSILKSIQEYDKKNIEFYVFVNNEFKGIIEDLNLKNCKILYKSTIVKNNKINLNAINELRGFNIENIYLPNPIIPSDLSCFLLINKYKNFYKINPKISKKYLMNRSTNSSFLSQQNLWCDLFFLSNKNKIKINKYLKYKQPKSALMLANDLLDNKNVITNLVDNKQNNNKKILFTIGASRGDKVLKKQYINEIYNKFNNIIFVGTNKDIKFINDLDISKNKILSNLSLFQLYELVKKSNKIIAYDTGLYHIANFLNKKIILIINTSFVSWKYLENFWFGDSNKNVKKILLEKKYFQ